METTVHKVITVQLNNDDIVQALTSYCLNLSVISNKEYSAIHLEMYYHPDDPMKNAIIIKFAKKLNGI